MLKVRDNNDYMNYFKEMALSTCVPVCERLLISKVVKVGDNNDYTDCL